MQFAADPMPFIDFEQQGIVILLHSSYRPLKFSNAIIQKVL